MRDTKRLMRKGNNESPSVLDLHSSRREKKRVGQLALSNNAEFVDLQSTVTCAVHVLSWSPVVKETEIGGKNTRFSLPLPPFFTRNAISKQNTRAVFLTLASALAPPTDARQAQRQL